MTETGYADGTWRLPRPEFLGGTNPGCLRCGGKKHGRDPRQRKVCNCTDPQFQNVILPRMHAFQAWCEQWAAELLRVARPGAHLLAFGGTRTYHRLACAVEDAGWEIRDSIGVLGWTYGQGFPKSRDVSKDIDAAAGAVREVVGKYVHPKLGPGWASYPSGEKTYEPSATFGRIGRREITAPATEDAARWQGWGTALKPAWEPIILARKPLSGPVAANVLRYGTGALNVDGSRVETNGEQVWTHRAGNGAIVGLGTEDSMPRYQSGDAERGDRGGRWPPNLVLVHHPGCTERCLPGCHVAEMDRQSGVQRDGVAVRRNIGKSGGNFPFGAADPTMREDMTYGGSGGVSRFYSIFRYEPKAGPDERPVIVRDGQQIRHPTVKPVDLMRWLVRLITPPGGLILDPFCGTGPTLQAAVLEGFHAVGLDNDPESCAMTRQRLSWPVRVDRGGRFERLTPQPTPNGQLSLLEEAL